MSLGDVPCLVKLIHLSLNTLGTSGHAGSPGIPGTKLAWPELTPAIPCSSWFVVTTTLPDKERRSWDNQVSIVLHSSVPYWSLIHRGNKHPEYFISIQLSCSNECMYLVCHDLNCKNLAQCCNSFFSFANKNLTGMHRDTLTTLL